MRIYIGADHQGFELKEQLKSSLIDEGYEVEDLGNHVFDPDDDYVDYAIKVAEAIEGGQIHDKGILICGSGHGMDVVANRFPGVRGVLGFNLEVTRQGRNDEDANVLIIPGAWTSEEEAKERVDLFLMTEKSVEDRHVRRRARIESLRAK